MIEEGSFCKNYTDNLMFRALGVEENPDYQMYVPFYDPFMIIEKTELRQLYLCRWRNIDICLSDVGAMPPHFSVKIVLSILLNYRFH